MREMMNCTQKLNCYWESKMTPSRIFELFEKIFSERKEIIGKSGSNDSSKVSLHDSKVKLAAFYLQVEINSAASFSNTKRFGSVKFDDKISCNNEKLIESATFKL